jgi:hypothetical protein
MVSYFYSHVSYQRSVTLQVYISDALGFVVIAITLVMLCCCYSYGHSRKLKMRDINGLSASEFFTACFGGVIACVDAMVFLIGLVVCVMSVIRVAYVNCLVDVADFGIAGLILVADLVGKTTFAVLASAKLWLLDVVVSITYGVDGLVRGAVLDVSVGLTPAKLLSKEYDLVMRGIELIDYHHFLPLGKFPQPASALANFAPITVIIISVICFKLSSKRTQSTKGQKHPENMRRAILIDAPTPQDPRADGTLRVAVLLTEHSECSICYELFSTDTGATDENIRECLPVQSATCRHYFCHGCILRIQAQKATSSFGVVPERIACCYCSAVDAFCPTRPNYHWTLIDILQRSTTGRFERQGEWLLCGFILVVLMGIVGAGTFHSLVNFFDLHNK